ncbi:hypothetical protein [Variovorax sp.]|jgi:hypothetical protein|uniref:phage adaptor protein n=1 Tax=Variovorax sp. TaxID=1871043 RepID=UPI0037DA1ACE
MNLGDLIAAFRVDAADRADPPLFADEDVIVWLNEAEQEAAVRGRLLHESADPDFCTIAVQAGVAVYNLHSGLYELDWIVFEPADGSDHQQVTLKSAGELDRSMRDWRTRPGRVEHAVQDDKTLRLARKPAVAGVLRLEGYRLPLIAMEDDSDEPEINRVHHRHLVNWALFRAFSVPDADTFDPVRAGRAEVAFASYFGLPTDSDLRRSTRHDEDHQTVVYR